MRKHQYLWLLLLAFLLCFTSCDLSSYETNHMTESEHGGGIAPTDKTESTSSEEGTTEGNSTTVAPGENDAGAPVIKESEDVTEYVRLFVRYTDAVGVEKTGNIIVKLEPEHAPVTVANFQKLVKEGFYNGLIFHRVVKSFVIQGGDPKGTGYGGSSETIKGEFSSNGVDNPLKHVAGTISMARSRLPDSASSQFFIVTETSPNNSYSLDGKYAAFGNVVYGMEHVTGIAGTRTGLRDCPINEAKILSATFVNYTVESSS